VEAPVSAHSSHSPSPLRRPRPSRVVPLAAALGTLLLPTLALASGGGSGHPPPAAWTTVFFILMLLGIAIIPLTPLEHWWHKNTNKLVFGLALALYPLVYLLVLQPNTHLLLETMHEYFSFIVLLGTLFYVSGGIYLRGDLAATPSTNVKFLAFGTLFASIVGTTGASMLLIRPVLRTNAERKNKVHIVVFFIFLVSNVGGSLLPIGDPPLFLGYLKGVPFLWTLGLWKHMLTVSLLLLVVFYFMDRHFYAKESAKDLEKDVAAVEPLSIEGKINILWLVGIVLCVALIKHAWARDTAMLACAAASYFTSPKETREKNAFTWGPIVEVAVLFIGIFLTMIPALEILRAEGGSLGVDTPAKFFWASGILSSFLDNAPTYLVFLSTAQGMVEAGGLTGMGAMVSDTIQVPVVILEAISCGAVFMGANSYIGNGPNFMVKAIAEEQRVEMPSFFGYMKWSGLLLIPSFVLVTILFF
jgi:Na+/H+ antiporter NhaD/arsenite permease-like protein